MTEPTISTDETRPETSGQQLSAARQQRGLSIQHVASSLNLSSRVIEMIEADEMVERATLIYFKGYIRSYARLLEINDDRVDTWCANLVCLSPPQYTSGPVELPVFRQQARIKRGRRFYRILTGLFIIGLISMAVVWWQDQRQHKLNQVDLFSSVGLIQSSQAPLIKLKPAVRQIEAPENKVRATFKRANPVVATPPHSKALKPNYTLSKVSPGQ